MKRIFLLLGGALYLYASGQTTKEYKVTNTFHIASPGWWDYIAVNKEKIYLSHGTQVNILNENTGDSVGVLQNTNGVHGIAFDNELDRAYTSNGRTNTVTVFNLKNGEALAQIATGENPDAIMFEPHTKTILTCNGRSENLSVIDPKTNTVVKTIAVGGKPEEAVSDGNGRLFVNLEDKNEIAVIDLKTQSVTNRWSLHRGKGPTGLAYDKITKRLFAGCEKKLVVVNAETGSVVGELKIGEGCDGVAFDEGQKLIFTSNGEGSLTVIKENGPNQFNIVGNYPTKRGARTIALDEKNKMLFLPTADFEPSAKQNERPKMIPGSFQVLVVQAAK